MEKGILLEMLWRENQFEGMKLWDYDCPQVYEMKYEEIIGNEQIVFGELYDHYRLDNNYKDDWLNTVEKYSRKNQKLSDKKHTRDGSIQQWKKYYTQMLKEVFKNKHR